MAIQQQGEETANQGSDVDVKGIMDMIPHRYPFLMIDAVRHMKPAESAVGIKNVTINEPFFQGHFPQHPVMPGVLIIEAMAQTAGVLVVHTLGEAGRDKLVYFMTINGGKFRRPVTPGMQLRIYVNVTQHRGSVWKFQGQAIVDDQIVAQADFSAMLIDPEQA